MVTVKMSLGEVSAKLKALQKVSEIRMPMAASYKLSKIIKAMVEEVQDYEQQRMKLIDRYALKDKEGELVLVKNEVQFASKEKKREFYKEFDELCAVKVEIKALSIKISDFGSTELSANDFLLLDGFLKEDSEESDEN